MANAKTLVLACSLWVKDGADRKAIEPGTELTTALREAHKIDDALLARYVANGTVLALDADLAAEKETGASGGPSVRSRAKPAA